MTSKLIIILGIIAILFISGCVKDTNINVNNTNETKKNVTLEQKNKATLAIDKFGSCNEITDAIKNVQNNYGVYYKGRGGMVPLAADASFEEKATDYSGTNVQVQGVDEADIVKTDGRYIYSISNGKLHIVDAYPAPSAEVVSSTKIEIEPIEIFIDENRVIIIGYSNYNNYEKVGSSNELSYYPYWQSFTTIQIWDTKDKENPEKVKTIDFEGNYLSARKINSTIYFVINSYVYGETPEEIVPLYREGDNFTEVARCGDIGYLKPIISNNFAIIGSINLDNLEVNKNVIMGAGQNIYSSSENLYIADTEYSYGPVIPFIIDIMPTETTTKTIIHKFSLNNAEINYEGKGEAPGTILNQFSMDEHNGNFRIATTKGTVSRLGGSSSNNVYIFNKDLDMIGELEDLAPGESIYSTRFMGDRIYMVTFKKVDPLFVIDASDPENPKVLGKLKIPGYSDYLHPIDENHIIGLGKDTIEAEQGDFAWYQGIKMAVFDVSDVENPKEMYKEIIGDRGTDSYALHDHKAFLYNKEKNLLVIPVLLAEIDSEQKVSREEWGTVPLYGDYTFQGAYVYDLSLENGFKLKGRITHVEDEDSFKKAGYYYYGGGDEVKRSLYIGEYLYTVSDNKILANTLDDLELIRNLKLN